MASVEGKVVNMENSEFWNGRRVLVTGHTGFKGSWLTLWLTELGAQVTGVGLEPDTVPSLFKQLNLKNRLNSHYIADIRDGNWMKKIVENCQPEIILHLAAQPLVRKSYREPLKTWETNVMGSLYLLEAIKNLRNACAVVMVTTDKVYKNQGWIYGYREDDLLGGHDPYSASKAAAEIAIDSWRLSFCGKEEKQNPHLLIATGRAGNVIGGGDWAEDRIVPDTIRSLALGKILSIRNPHATRPWQHVLEPLGGYLRLAETLMMETNPPCEAFNFGPKLTNNKKVSELVNSIMDHWPGEWVDRRDLTAPHEADLLHLQIDKAHHRLGWQPRWNFTNTVERTVNWYKSVETGASPTECCLADIEAYTA